MAVIVYRVRTADRLLEAARQQVRTGGWRSVTTGSLCRSLGLSQPAFYRHYPTLDELFVSLHVAVLDQLAEAIEKARAPHDDPEQRVREAWRAYLRFALSEPELFRSAFDRPAVPELEQRWRRRMERGLAAIRSDVGDPVRVLEQWAAVHGLAELAISGRLARRSGGGPEALLEDILSRLG